LKHAVSIQVVQATTIYTFCVSS